MPFSVQRQSLADSQNQELGKLYSRRKQHAQARAKKQELRQTNFMAVVPYDRQIEPLIVTSPFHRGVRGPGFFAEPRGKPSGEDEEEEEVRRPPVAPPTTLQAAPSHPPEMLPTDTGKQTVEI